MQITTHIKQGNITTDTREIHNMITFPVGEYFRSVYTLLSQKSLKEVDEFLDSSRRDQYFNRSITSKIKTIIKTLPTKTRPGLDGITAEFCQTFKKIHNLYVFCFMCLSTMYVPDVTLELELQINVNHHVNWMLEMKPCLLQEQSS